MIKGVRLAGTGTALSYLDTLEVPIIENTPNEEDLKDSMAEAMIKYPNAAGVLVRRHGVYVWGESDCLSDGLFILTRWKACLGRRRRLRLRCVLLCCICTNSQISCRQPVS